MEGNLWGSLATTAATGETGEWPGVFGLVDTTGAERTDGFALQVEDTGSLLVAWEVLVQYFRLRDGVNIVIDHLPRGFCP